MKSTVFTCDRCKMQLMNANGVINTGALAVERITVTDIGFQDIVVDLCDGCYSATVDFLMGAI